MTTIYFIRHAQSDFSVIDDRTRPLTDKGIADCKLVTNFLHDKEIDIVLSSPYKRAVDTIKDFADIVKLPIKTVEDFRERDHVFVDDWRALVEKQWEDFTYSDPGDESLMDTQKRNISALNDAISLYKNKNIVIGTHGTALSTIINYFDATYGFNDFMKMVFLTPWVVKMVFKENACISIEKINLFD